MFDALHNGRRLKILTLEDEFTRQGLAIKVDKSIKAKDVICILADLFSERGAPMYLRSDNGPEFIEKALKEWLVRKRYGHHPYRTGKTMAERLYRELQLQSQG